MCQYFWPRWWLDHNLWWINEENHEIPKYSYTFSCHCRYMYVLALVRWDEPLIDNQLYRNKLVKGSWTPKARQFNPILQKIQCSKNSKNNSMLATIEGDQNNQWLCVQYKWKWWFLRKKHISALRIRIFQIYPSDKLGHVFFFLSFLHCHYDWVIFLKI